MTNDKYYIVKDNFIVSDGFDNFTDAIDTFFYFFNILNTNYLAIVRLSEINNLKGLQFSFNVNNFNYIFIKINNGNKHLEGPINVEDLRKIIKQRLNSYGNNKCDCFSILNTNFEDTKKLFNIN